MSITKSATYALFTFVATALLAACSSGATQPPTPSSGLGMNPSAALIPSPLRAAPRDLFSGIPWNGHNGPNHSKSWISPEVKKGLPRLLFGTDYTFGGAVFIFVMPQMSLRGVITGFLLPRGMCSDKQGNIYVADPIVGNVYKYSRAAQLVATYKDPEGSPNSCAVNPTNGDLAVANNTDGVAIFTGPSSTPTIETNIAEKYYYWLGYDTSGNLWVDGFSTAGAFILSSCGASGCSTIDISGGTIYQGGGVQWDSVRRTWVVFDALCEGKAAACSYPVSGTGKLGAQTKYLNYLGDAACNVAMGLVAAPHGMNYVVAGDYQTRGCPGDALSNFARWSYPAGGMPTNFVLEDGLTPWGVAISPK